MPADLDLMIEQIAQRAHAAGLRFDPSTAMIQFTFDLPGHTPEPKNAHMRCSTSMSLAHIYGSGRGELELAGEVVASATEHMQNVALWMPKHG